MIFPTLPNLDFCGIRIVCYFQLNLKYSCIEMQKQNFGCNRFSYAGIVLLLQNNKD